MLESLDMVQHSLGYLAVLVAKLGQENIENWGDLLAKCDTFISLCNPEQIRWVEFWRLDELSLIWSCFQVQS